MTAETGIRTQKQLQSKESIMYKNDVLFILCIVVHMYLHDLSCALTAPYCTFLATQASQVWFEENPTNSCCFGRGGDILTGAWPKRPSRACQIFPEAFGAVNFSATELLSRATGQDFAEVINSISQDTRHGYPEIRVMRHMSLVDPFGNPGHVTEPISTIRGHMISQIGTS